MVEESAIPYWADVITLAVLLIGIASLMFIRRDTDRHSWLIAWLVGENRRLARQVRILSMRLNVPYDPTPSEPLVPASRWSRFTTWLRTRTVPVEDEGPDPATVETAPEMPAQVKEAFRQMSPADDPEWRRRFGLD